MKRILIISFASFISLLNVASQDYISTIVYTCKNSAIAAYTTNNEMSNAQKAAARDAFLNTTGVFYHYKISASDILTDASYKYNCHGYAWHMKNGGTNSVWINNAISSASGCSPSTHNIDPYWNDLCFVEVAAPSAEKIHYYCGDHSAVKSTVSGKYESKWGQYPVIRHFPDSAPYVNTNQRKYYAKLQISGPSLVPCTGTVTYSLPTPLTAYSTVTWNVGALQLVSGQGTRTVTVQKSSSSTGTSATITATVTLSGTTHTLSETVDIGAPAITSVSGNTTVYPGSAFTYTATPVFAASQGDYLWTVTPKPGVTIVNNRSTCNITFPSVGTYTVGVRSESSCTAASTVTKTITVSVTNAYYVSTDDNKLVTVSAANNAANATARGVAQTIAYTLYNQATGAMVAKGVIPATGGTLDFSRLPDGIYLLSLDSGNGKIDTHRIALN
jgi:hypothetical protein